MFITSRRASHRFSAFLLCAAITVPLAAKSMQPDEYWVLENRDPEKPYGGLKLNRLNSRFAILLFDSNCQLYRAEGNVRQNNQGINAVWELKNQADHSNVFIMTEEAHSLKLVDTEGQIMLFTPASEAALDKELKTARYLHCQLSQR